MAESFARIEGLKEIQANLRRIATEIHKASDSPVRFGLRKGGNVLRDQARRNAGRRTGALADAIRVRLAPKRDRKLGSVMMQVYVGKGKAHIGYWREYGTGVFFTGRRIKPKKKRILFNPKTLEIYGASAEGQPPHPFMRPALAQAGRRAIDAFADGMRSKIKTLERRRGRRA